MSNYLVDEVKRKLKIYFKFVFVWEFFEWFLFVYLDKFLWGEFVFYYNYGKCIIMLYRLGGNLEDKNVKFDEYLNYVLYIGDGYWNEYW